MEHIPMEKLVKEMCDTVYTKALRKHHAGTDRVFYKRHKNAFQSVRNYKQLLTGLVPNQEDMNKYAKMIQDSYEKGDADGFNEACENAMEADFA